MSPKALKLRNSALVWVLALLSAWPNYLWSAQKASSNPKILVSAPSAFHGKQLHSLGRELFGRLAYFSHLPGAQKKFSLAEQASYARSFETRLQSLGPMNPHNSVERDGLLAAARARFHSLQNEALQKSVVNSPIGEEEYAWHLNNNVGINESPAELSHKGMKMAEKIRQEMQALSKDIDSSQDLPGVMADLGKDHPGDDAALFAAYGHAAQRAEDFAVAKGLFKKPEGFYLKIAATPKKERATTPLAAYDAEDGSFNITPAEGNLQQMEFHNIHQLPAIAVHEGFPGHALQFSNFKNEPDTYGRMIISENGYLRSLNLEGYAFYTEALMSRHGFFSPKEDLMRLKMKLLRAYRLVVDPAIHSGFMSLEEAARLLTEKAFLPAPAAAAEVHRYVLKPTQATTYMIGSLQIEELKEAYKNILGPLFNEADFHQSFFSFGLFPPRIIAEAMLAQAREARNAITSLSFQASPGHP